ncbi:hypothetical protein TRAPUB_7837 [Trametes pubescens]|uniref:Uncharacterized protein n=1 Tax=Trametes pubescens TaxID=154538 RepID=A0A1M2V2F1_TRAPU|nr:hypothetical protein TRAPUB_7837 [Trametes pubescens]
MLIGIDIISPFLMVPLVLYSSALRCPKVQHGMINLQGPVKLLVLGFGGRRRTANSDTAGMRWCGTQRGRRARDEPDFASFSKDGSNKTTRGYDLEYRTAREVITGFLTQRVPPPSSDESSDIEEALSSDRE